MNPAEDHLRCLRAILRAQDTPDPEDDLAAHLEAVASGPAILPAILEVLRSSDWSTPKPRGKVAIFTALLLVVHDVDEVAARELSVELTDEERLHPAFRHRLASINRLTLGDYCRCTIRGLHVWIAKAVGDPAVPEKLLRRWLSVVPWEDLAGISRLYVTDVTEDRYWGQYLRILAKISLVWRDGAGERARARLATELTLYHEIGHHVHRAESLGKAEGEDRADKYASECFAAAHPVLGRGFLGRFVTAFVMGRALPSGGPSD